MDSASLGAAVEEEEATEECDGDSPSSGELGAEGNETRTSTFGAECAE